MNPSWQAPWIARLLAHQELKRLRADALVRTLLLLAVGELVVSAVAQPLDIFRGLWPPLTHIFLLTLLLPLPLYWLVFRPAAQVVARAVTTSAEVRFQAVVEAVSDALLVSDDQGVVVFGNTAACALFGYRLEDLLGRPLPTLLPTPQTLAPSAASGAGRAAWRSAAAQPEGCRRDGTRFAVECSTRQARIGEQDWLITVGRDVTARRETERELERLASFPRLDPNPVLECDAEGRVTYANPAALRLLQTLGGPAPLGRLLPANLPELVRSCLGDAEKQCQHETRVDGRTLLWSLNPLPAGNCVRIYGTDITARQQAEEALRESEVRFRQLVETLPVAVRVTQQGVVAFTNPAGASLFGYEGPEALVGVDAFLAVAEEDVPRLRAYMVKRAAGEDVPTRYEFRARRRDGAEFPAEAVVTRISYRGQPASLAVLLDLTERKRLRLFESLLPVCCMCGKVRDDTRKKTGQAPWRPLEEYVVEHSDADLTHTFCPDCYRAYREGEGLPPGEPPADER